MSTDLHHPSVDEAVETDPMPTPPADEVVVRRDGMVLALVALVAGLMALAYLSRAIGSGSVLDIVLCVVTGAVAVVYLSAVVDGRLPLMVLDRHGVRARTGAEWQGVAWPDVDHVEHRPRRGLLRDGRLVVHEAETGRTLAVRLSVATRLMGADWDELTDAVDDLSGGRTDVVEPTPSVTAKEPASDADDADDAHKVGDNGDDGDADGATDDIHDHIDDDIDDDTDTQTSRAIESADPTPTDVEPAAPEREVTGASRSDVVLPPAPVARLVPEPAAESRPEEVTSVTEVIGLEPEPAEPHEPVVGAPLAAARRRLGLSVESLAERTRIRPHVIEAVEIDDFGPCGGDFYARGHLRTLCRVLGVDARPVLAAYDERYADEPIDARRVFESELATASGGPIRRTRGGLNWSVLVAVVMALVLAWSVARLLMDHPAPVSQRPILNGSPQGKAVLSSQTTAVPVELNAATGGAKVIVRSGDGHVVFDDAVPFGGTVDVKAAPPVRVSSSDGGLTVSVDGTDKGAIGRTGHRAEQTYVP